MVKLAKPNRSHQRRHTARAPNKSHHDCDNTTTPTDKFGILSTDFSPTKADPTY